MRVFLGVPLGPNDAPAPEVLEYLLRLSQLVESEVHGPCLDGGFLVVQLVVL